jgi:hypothetical protein
MDGADEVAMQSEMPTHYLYVLNQRRPMKPLCGIRQMLVARYDRQSSEPIIRDEATIAIRKLRRPTAR